MKLLNKKGEKEIKKKNIDKETEEALKIQKELGEEDLSEMANEAIERIQEETNEEP